MKITWIAESTTRWRSGNGEYLIMKLELTPVGATNPEFSFQLRHISFHDPSVPANEQMGYLLTERWSFDELKAEAERHAFCQRAGRERSVPEDHQALAMERFFWPISDGTTKAALTVEDVDGRLVARVVGRTRGETSPPPNFPFVTATWVEIDLDEVLARRAAGV